ncbi:MAG: ATP-dependent zinc metalloprotease FtsH [Chloroflexota bacterium]
MFPPNRNNQNNSGDNKPEQGEKEDGQRPQFDFPRWAIFIVLGLLLSWLFVNLSGANPIAGNPVEITYDDFYTLVEQGNVESVTIRGSEATGEFVGQINYPLTPSEGQEVVTTETFSTTIPNIEDSSLIALLRENNVSFRAESTALNPFVIFLIQWAPFLLIIGLVFFFMRRAQRQASSGIFGFGQSQAREYKSDFPQVTFDDVAGQDAAKQELEEVVDFLKEPDKYISLGAKIPRGVLLVGPPGTGKTLMARAVAGEANVAFFSLSASEFVEMFVGVGASRVRDLFKKAKDAAPSIVFIDEIDAVGRQRGAGLGGGNDEREQTLNQMLAEMDGFDQTESVIVIAATNRPDVLDPALLRPGRFDRQVTVGAPDRSGRLAILKIHTRGKPLAEDVELDDLAKATIGFSGADLANLANEAALTAARKNHKRISGRDFSDAFDRIVLGTESPPLSNEEERRVVAYHEAGHAIAAMLTPGADPVLKVTIVPRGQALGVTATMPDDERRNYSRPYLMSRMVMMLGGRAAEEVTFGEVTTGASDDLRRVTDLARRMVAQFGMSEKLGQVNFGDNEQQPFLGYSISQGRNYSDQTAYLIDQEVREIVESLYDRTVTLMRENQDKLEALALELLENEVVEAQRVLEISGADREISAAGTLISSAGDDVVYGTGEGENDMILDPKDETDEEPIESGD